MPRIRLKNKNYIKTERVIKPPVWQKMNFWLIVILIYAVWIYGLRRLFATPSTTRAGETSSGQGKEKPPAERQEVFFMCSIFL